MSQSSDIAVRSLRRRLWRAFQEEDADSAIRAYTATRADYQDWIAEEAAAADEKRADQEKARLRIKKEKSDARPAALKKFGSFMRSTRNGLKAVDTSFRNEPSARLSGSSQTASPEGKKESTGVKLDQPCLLQLTMNPSELFIPDDFKSPYDSYDDPDVINQRLASFRKSQLPPSRLVVGLWGLGGRGDSDDDDSSQEESQEPVVERIVTTPLHEAARLGSGTLIRLMLPHESRPNFRNGKQRTALHMVAGGLTAEEEGLLKAYSHHRGQLEQTQLNQKAKTDILVPGVGIRAPAMDIQTAQDETLDHPAAVGAKKAAKVVMSRLFKNKFGDEEKEPEQPNAMQRILPLDMKRFNVVAADRMDAALAILSWNHPDDGSSCAGEGPSINSVDALGRTALHYAAELGRTDICMAVLSSFGAILTIVDESSRTPCELAGDRGHDSLAAKLEARALLYLDPYGMDEELMGSEFPDDQDDFGNQDAYTRGRKALVPPFSWFETMNMKQVQIERRRRLDQTLQKMRETAKVLHKNNSTLEFLFNHGVDDSMDSAVNGDSLMTQEGHETKEVSCTVGTEDLEPSQHSETTVEWRDSVREDQPNSASVSGNESVRQSCARAPPTSSHDVNKRNGASSSEHANPGCIKESHAELLLAHYGWNLEKVISALERHPSGSLRRVNVCVSEPVLLNQAEKRDPSPTCLICCEEFDADASHWRYLMNCEHGFCTDCLGDYIAECARTKSTGLSVTCPHHECSVLLAQSELTDLAPSLTVYHRLVEAADENFIAAATDVKYCPYPGCEGVVKLCAPSWSEHVDLDLVGICGAVCTACSGSPEADSENWPLTYEGVRDRCYCMVKGSSQPRKAHRFCFACGSKNIHWPVSCGLLEEWNTRIEEEVGKLDESNSLKGGEKFEEVAHRLWLKANTRPCPKCKAHIEKNDGCNHMTCSNRHCRHEFCWICRKDWKLHNTETGGFFRCNIWQDEESQEFNENQHSPPQPSHATNGLNVPDAEQYGTASHSAIVARKKSKEMNRFLHHYRRWSAHSESAALEKNMADTVCSRLSPVIDAAIEFTSDQNFNFDGKGLSFVHAAFFELLECRSLLQHSYAFAYFRYPTQDLFRLAQATRRAKKRFEQLQSELEMLTEQMSDIVARSHLRATKTQIVFLTSNAAAKRNELSSVMVTLLNEERREKRGDEKKDAARSGRTASLMSTRLDSENSDSDDESLPSSLRLRLEMEEEEAMQDMQQALQESMRYYTPQIQPDQHLEIMDGDDTTETRLTWSCSACTYTNVGGTLCAMCNTSSDASGEPMMEVTMPF